MTADVAARQDGYIAGSAPVEAADVAAWSPGGGFWNNAIAMFGPVL